MQTPSLPLSPAPADLKNLLIPSSHHSLHAKFRRGMKKPCAGGDGINMRFRGGGGYSTGGLDFQITVLNKKFSDAL